MGKIAILYVFALQQRRLPPGSIYKVSSRAGTKSWAVQLSAVDTFSLSESEPPLLQERTDRRDLASQREGRWKRTQRELCVVHLHV